jgi:hypothetical protein
MMKICSCCKIEKSLTDFGADKSRKNGLYVYCRDCARIQSAKSIKRIRKENPEKAKEQAKKDKQTISGKYGEYKDSAKRRNMTFDLTRNEFITFWQKPCHYCDAPINTIGIDRKYNNIGYTLDNCLSCCITCNRGKRESTYEEYIEHCKRMAKKWADAI